VCDAGYTVAVWVNFTHVAGRQPYVYVSNGGHSQSSHGVAIIYDGGNLAVRFRSRVDGREWTARSDNVLPGRWYHVAAAWNALDGLSLYVNGDLAHRDQLPRPRPPVAGARSDEFLIGKPNDEVRVADRHPLAVDDFNFWSDYKNASAVKQLGLSLASALTFILLTVILSCNVIDSQ